MPKRTAKFVAAESTARKNKIRPTGEAEDLYNRLADAGFMWDSKRGEWINLAAEPAELPMNKIMVRVWSKGEEVRQIAEDLVMSMNMVGYSLIQMSEPYPCRPPKQLESRIYIEFARRDFSEVALNLLAQEEE